jgi:hypothetical protein
MRELASAPMPTYLKFRPGRPLSCATEHALYFSIARCRRNVPASRGSQHRRSQQRITRGKFMLGRTRNFSAAIALAAGWLLALPAGAQVVDFGKYPDWKGQWTRAPVPGVTSFTYGPPWDPGKPEARGQQAPLTPEYRAIFEANLADQAAGGPGTWYGHTCRGHGIPAIMSVFFPMEIVILPEITYLVANDVHVFDESLPMVVGGRKISNRPISAASLSANGSTRAGAVVTTRLKSRPADSRARARSTSAAFPCTKTIRPSSKNESTSTRPTAICCTTRSPYWTML